MMDFYAIQTQTGWRYTLESFADWCDPHPGGQVLDVGSGPGLLPFLLRQRGCSAWGVDIDQELVRQKRLGQSMLLADALFLPFPAHTFNLVTASNLLFFLADPGAALREMARLALPGGQVCLLNPSENLSLESAARLVKQRNLQGIAGSSLLDWAERAERHQRWSEPELDELYTNAGLMLLETDLRIGPGLARFARGLKPA
jgi:ubiquinone/menaquinone biosynthesis C-methylase UbiE